MPLAKIKKLPSQAIISGFKGKLDYYVHDGQPCVRSWPRSPGKRRSPSVEAQWPAFRYAAQAWITLPEYIKDAYRKTAENTGLTGRDMFTRTYLKSPLPIPPLPPIQYLNDLLNVEVPSPTDGDVLYFDEAAGQWKGK
ncbi:hypothetical protein ES703_93629 [subsurface metagenome]